MKWLLWAVGGLFLAVLVVLGMFVLSARAAARAALGRTKKEDAIEQKAKADARAIVEQSDNEKAEVANADGETLVKRIRARLARGLRG